MDPFLGEVRLFSFGKIPKNWTPCNGQLLSVQLNQALFSLLGTAYGGNGTSTFGVPNLMGNVPLGFSAGYIIGNTGGEVTHALSLAEIPPHTHSVACFAGVGGTSGPSGNFHAASESPNNVAFDSYYATTANATMAPGAIAQAGSGLGHNNMQPFLVLNFCICLAGIFPTKP